MSLSLILSLTFLIQGFSDNDLQVDKKIYVHPEELSLTKEGIFAKVYGLWLQMDAIEVDENGIYVISRTPSLSSWQCPASDCKAWNMNFLSKCWNCGTPRPKVKKQNYLAMD